MSDYLPINLNSLISETTIGCDIYLLVKTSASSRYVLYCREDAVFDTDKKETLVKKNLDKIFISKDDQQKYFKYLESNFQNITSDASIPPDEKAQVVYNIAINLIEDTFEDPRAGNIKKAKTFARNMADYILKDKRASHSLLKIAKHEYYTYTHSVSTAAIGTLFANDLGLMESDLKQFCTGALLHDIGKTKISADILNKKGKLTEEEFEMIKEHCESGVQILKETGNSFKDEYKIILQHHENCDGSGYPHGLKKEEIHYSSRIVHIIDIYDALTTKRSYSDVQNPYDALRKIRNEMLNKIDKVIFEKFIKFLGSSGDLRMK